MTDAFDALALALVSFASVVLWTVRVALTADRRSGAAALVAAVEATTFAVAFSQLVGRISSPASIGAYALGVAAGTVAALRGEYRVRRVISSRAGGGRRTIDPLGSEACRVR